MDRKKKILGVAEKIIYEFCYLSLIVFTVAFIIAMIRENPLCTTEKLQVFVVVLSWRVAINDSRYFRKRG